MYIYEMPYASRQRLVDVLNVNDAWRELGGNAMGYDQIELDKFRRAVYQPGNSPADALLTAWGQRNHTVQELFVQLCKMKHFQAMDAIKDSVDAKYHKYIQTNTSGPGLTQSMSMTKSSAVPPPPKTYNRANQDPNLFADASYGEDKWNPKKLDHKVNNGSSSEKSVTADQQVDLLTMDNNDMGAAAYLRVLTPEGASPSSATTSQNGSNHHLTPLRYNQGHQAGANRLSPIITTNQTGTTYQLVSPGGNMTNISGVPSSLGTRFSEPSCSRLKQRNPSGIPQSDPDIMLRKVPFSELVQACNNFDAKNILGRGGFGEVYRGRWNGQDVAVKRIREDKRLKNESGFQKYVDQAITELQALHTFPAENILPLLAFHYVETMESDPCLVYQLMPNGSVSDRLRCKNKTPPLSWKTRANIALGTARGLCHLHANKIIHGDIKGPNILLDKHFEPKIGDFGLARGGPESDEFSYKLVSSVQGTASYLPDDYVRSRHLTSAVDTFCYGIFLFELVTGKAPSWKCQQTGQTMRDMMLEARLPGDLVDKSPNEFSPWPNFLFLLGRDCARSSRRARPDMQRVFIALEKLDSYPSSLALQKYYDIRSLPAASGGEPSTTNDLSQGPSYTNIRHPQAERSKNIPAILEQDDTSSERSKTPTQQGVNQEQIQVEETSNKSDNIPAFLETSDISPDPSVMPVSDENSRTSASLASASQTSTNLQESEGIPAILGLDSCVADSGSASILITSQDEESSTETTTHSEFLLEEPSLPLLSEHIKSLKLVTDKPNLPDLPNLTLPNRNEDPLANNRVLSVEFGVEQAAFIGIFK